MDIERTKRFYRDLKRSNLCDCAYCRNYVNEAAKAYPAVTAYLQTLGVDIAKPFETMPLELDEDGRMPYIGPQYLVFGEEEGFAAATVRDVNDVEVRLAQSHPGDDIQEPHFVIEIEPIFLPWTVERKQIGETKKMMKKFLIALFSLVSILALTGYGGRVTSGAEN